MGYGFDLSFIQRECGFQKFLSVTGRAGSDNFRTCGQIFLQFPHGAFCGLYGVAMIICVIGKEQLTSVSDQSQLGCRGTCVDSEKTISLVFSQFLLFNDGFFVAAAKRFIFRLTLKQR